MTEIRRVEIRKSDIGRLIGKGGSTIKSLTSSYSVDIDIPKEDLDGDGKIDVSIEGSRANVEACLTKISQIVGYLPQPVDGASPASAIEHKDLDAVLIREVLFFPDPTEKSFQSFMVRAITNIILQIVSNLFSLTFDRRNGVLISASLLCLIKTLPTICSWRTNRESKCES